MQAGAGAYEPSVSYAGGTWRFNNVAKGEQASSGPQGTVLGTVSELLCMLPYQCMHAKAGSIVRST